MIRTVLITLDLRKIEGAIQSECDFPLHSCNKQAREVKLVSFDGAQGSDREV